MAHAQKPAERHDPHLDPTYDHFDYPVIAPAPQFGHPGYTTEIQEAQVTQLRMMLEQEGIKDNLDTLTLVRAARGMCVCGGAHLTTLAAKISARTKIQCRACEEDVRMDYPCAKVERGR